MCHIGGGHDGFHHDRGFQFIRIIRHQHTLIIRRRFDRGIVGIGLIGFGRCHGTPATVCFQCFSGQIDGP